MLSNEDSSVPELDALKQPLIPADVEMSSSDESRSTGDEGRAEIIVKDDVIKYLPRFALFDVSCLPAVAKSEEDPFEKPQEAADDGVEHGITDMREESGLISQDHNSKKPECTSNVAHETVTVCGDQLPQCSKQLDIEAKNLKAPSTEPDLKAHSYKEERLLDYKIFDWDNILNEDHASESLPELETYWKAVKDDPSNFSAWEQLLQYVGERNDVEAARTAYDNFFFKYPYCDGDWKEYSDYEERQGNLEKCHEVLERGLKATPLSVQLWLYYMDHCKITLKHDSELLREQFEKAVDTCGLEFRSSELWSMYVQWEMENGQYRRVLKVYDRILTTPLQNFHSLFEQFEDFIVQLHPYEILSEDDFFAIRSYVINKYKLDHPDTACCCPPFLNSDVIHTQSDKEVYYMKDRIMLLRYRVYCSTLTKINQRLSYESSIERTFFHMLPLKKFELDNWDKYLDHESKLGDFKRTVVLFERALIVCAKYKQFWLKYLMYLRKSGADARIIRNVYMRACLVHLAGHYDFALDWALFEESQGNLTLARKILTYTDEKAGQMMLVQLRRIQFERRCGNVDRATQLFEHYIAISTQVCTAVALISKYAEFCHRILGTPEKAYQLLTDCVAKYPSEHRIYYQLLDLVHITTTGFDQRFIDVCNMVLGNPAVDSKTKLDFALKKWQFYEDVGPNLLEAGPAHLEYFNMLQKFREEQAGSPVVP